MFPQKLGLLPGSQLSPSLMIVFRLRELSLHWLVKRWKSKRPKSLDSIWETSEGEHQLQSYLSDQLSPLCEQCYSSSSPSTQFCFLDFLSQALSQRALSNNPCACKCHISECDFWGTLASSLFLINSILKLYALWKEMGKALHLFHYFTIILLKSCAYCLKKKTTKTYNASLFFLFPHS